MKFLLRDDREKPDKQVVEIVEDDRILVHMSINDDGTGIVIVGSSFGSIEAGCGFPTQVHLKCGESIGDAQFFSLIIHLQRVIFSAK